MVYYQLNVIIGMNKKVT